MFAGEIIFNKGDRSPEKKNSDFDTDEGNGEIGKLDSGISFFDDMVVSDQKGMDPFSARWRQKVFIFKMYPNRILIPHKIDKRKQQCNNSV